MFKISVYWATCFGILGGVWLPSQTVKKCYALLSFLESPGKLSEIHCKICGHPEYTHGSLKYFVDYMHLTGHLSPSLQTFQTLKNVTKIHY